MAVSIISRKLKEFEDRLWLFKQQNKHCDAELTINGERISVHSVVLASCSEYFDTSFASSKSPKRITIEERVDIMNFLSVIEYCYSGSITITEENAKELAKIANFLIIPTIIEGASKMLENKLNISNCLETWKFAKTEHFQTLNEAAIDLVQKNFEEIYNSKEFSALEYADVKELLNSKLIVTSENKIFDAVKIWVKHDETSRKKNLYNLLDHVKLSCLSYDTLISEPRSLCSSTDCYQKFFDALELQKKIDFSKCERTTTLLAFGLDEETIPETMEIFDMKNEKWIDINIKPFSNLTRFTVILLNDKLMSIGGFKNNLEVNSIECYDLKSGRIESYPSLKYGRYYPSAIKYEGFVFVIGGVKQDVVAFVERFDPTSKSWTEVTPISTPRYLCGIAVLNHEIYVVGGHGLDGNLSSTEAYNLVTDKWRPRASMNEIRAEHSVVAVNGYLYAMGGWNGSSAMNTVEKYDPTIDKWTLIESINPPRHAFGGTTHMGKLTIAGGYGKNPGSHLSVMIYDENDHKWEHMVPLNKPRTFFSLIEIPWGLAVSAISRKVY